MTYDEALNYIHDNRWRVSRRGLGRIRELLGKLGGPQKRLKYVHVAGTNGKGSTSACIAKILECAGYRVGLYTSPFIERYNERIQINGTEIPDSVLAEYVEKTAPLADGMEDHPSEFEIGTAIAFDYFADNHCDIVVLEVGMGGEFDATNVIDESEVTVFAAIGMDHMMYLGSALGEIARTKSGIVKEGGCVVSYIQEPEAMTEIENRCRQMGAELETADFSKISGLKYTLDGTEFNYDGLHISLSLTGPYQPYNAVLALTAVKKLREKGWNIKDGDVLRGFSSVYWPGRFEVLSRDPVFILDGAHNSHGIKAAVKGFDELLHGRKIVFIIGVMADKDIDKMLPLLLPYAKCFVTLTPNNPRAMDSVRLAELIRSLGAEAYPYSEIEEGVRAAVNMAQGDGAVCALGSLYYSADVKKAARNVLGKR